MYLVVGNDLVARPAITSKDNLFINILPPLLDCSFFVELLFKEIAQFLLRVLRKLVFFLVLDEGEIAMLKVLGDYKSDKTGEIA